MAVPLLDLKLQYRALKEELVGALLEVCEAQAFVLGPVVEKLEEQVAQYCGCAHAVGVSSGTDALLAVLMALGIGAGDEVIVPSFTFFATAGSVHRVGATPVFADVQLESFNIDPAAVAAAVTPRTKAIIAVHLFGRCADLDALRRAAGDGLVILEDAAQAIGARYRGRRAGSLGIGCFSFYPTKNLGGFGDGGIITTNDAELAQELRLLRNHGEHLRYHHAKVGGNFRLDALQAAVLAVKIKYLEQWHAARRRNAERYRRLFAEKNLPQVSLPQEPPGGGHVYNQFTLRCLRRDELKAHLEACRIGNAIYYPVPLHLQECFAHLGYRRGQLPVSERLAGEVLSIPIYPELTEAQQREVVEAIAEFYGAS